MAPAPDVAATPGPARTTSGPALPDVAPQGEPCGHRSMNGRACTREAGHAAKNHRYG